MVREKEHCSGRISLVCEGNRIGRVAGEQKTKIYGSPVVEEVGVILRASVEEKEDEHAFREVMKTVLVVLFFIALPIYLRFI